jgi:hypothetical protein
MPGKKMPGSRAGQNIHQRRRIGGDNTKYRCGDFSVIRIV